MATVHLARMRGPAGFSRTVAAKRLHPHLARDAEFLGMFLDEARLAARVKHPNVVAVDDVVVEDKDVMLVMDHVHGEVLSRLLKKGKVPQPIALALASGILAGLQAVHEATDENGRPLEIVHRDLSTKNVMVSAAGVPRIVDFGIAKALNRVQETVDGQLKGTAAYMAPEQVTGEYPITRASDIFAAGAVLWELLAGKRLFDAPERGQLLFLVSNVAVRPLSDHADVSPELEAVVMKALEKDPALRWASAREMAAALPPGATTLEVSEWVKEVAGDALAERAALVSRVERGEDSKTAAKAVVDRVAESTMTMETTTPKKRSRAWMLFAAAGLVLVSGALAFVRVRQQGEALVIKAAARWAPPPSAVQALPPTTSTVAPPSSPKRLAPAARPAPPRPAPKSDGLFERN
jgi:serine/threonine-protein kinase